MESSPSLLEMMKNVVAGIILLPFIVINFKVPIKKYHDSSFLQLIKSWDTEGDLNKFLKLVY